MKLQTSIIFSLDHPSLAGHFPGTPVVPGVVVLDEVRMILERRDPSIFVSGIDQVKFLAPILPGDEITVEIEPNNDKCRFRCLRGDTLVSQGQFSLTAHH